MKLLVVLEHRFYQDPEGGVYCERVVDYNFIKRYLNVFEEVVVCGRFKTMDSPINKRLRVDGDNVSFVKLADFKGPKEMVLKYFSSNRILKKAIRECDAVLLRAPSPISFLSFSAVKKEKKPFAVEMVANPRTAMQDNSDDNIFTRIINRLIKVVWINHAKNVCMNANGVSYVTQYALQKEYPSYARIYGESKEYFEDVYSTINLKENDYYQGKYLNPHNATFTICHTGYMDGKTKGHITVIDTLNILLKAGYDVNVKFIGSGSLMEEFKDYAKRLGIIENVEFLGSLYGYNEVQKELVTSDMFLFPTMSEGLPRSLIEAMANKLPCVSSPVDGIPELLDEKYLAPYNSPQLLAQKVEYILNNPSIREKAALENFNKAKEYSESVLTPRRNRFYSKLNDLALITKIK
ncbi:glycosyltransferase family 4 protein [Psychrobacillus sp. OK032]|uniref:glycosyltransferase family 4 protein n=1 Tax=Psychrobacillus sp. OK032 TaxID=1884358 RepID=UPI0008C4E243|nr:glycosyltransferase family 4 protein [Psychrobacillus sp. OK032]SER70949.1 Glycosyltransferase involved in cell wall bisynthesis [Psychrobacillus sp. OK032]